MMLGLAAIVAMITVIASIFAGFYRYLDRSMSADYLLIPQSIVLGQGNVATAGRGWPSRSATSQASGRSPPSASPRARSPAA